MHEVGVWVLRHPKGVGAVLSIMLGISAWQMWRLGVQTGELRGVLGEEARVASERLGG